MEFQDRILSCVDCGAEFIWTAGEQQFFSDKNFKTSQSGAKPVRASARLDRPAAGCPANGSKRKPVAQPVVRIRRCPSSRPRGARCLQRMLPVPEIRRGRGLADTPAGSRSSRLIDHDPRGRRAQQGDSSYARGAAFAPLEPGEARWPRTYIACGRGRVLSSHRDFIWSVSMQIEERAVGDRRRTRPEGQDHLGEGDELLKDKVNSLVNQGHKKIVLNLADVPYIDSAGLGEVVRTYTTVSARAAASNC